MLARQKASCLLLREPPRFPHLDDDELLLADFIPAAFVVCLDDVARHGTHKLMPKAVSGRAVDLPE
jgi:hypothetical protein